MLKASNIMLLALLFVFELLENLGEYSVGNALHSIVTGVSGNALMLEEAFCHSSLVLFKIGQMAEGITLLLTNLA